MLYLLPQPLSPMARLTVVRCRARPIPICSQVYHVRTQPHRCIHSMEQISALRDNFDERRGTRHRNVICCAASISTWCAKPVRVSRAGSGTHCTHFLPICKENTFERKCSRPRSHRSTTRRPNKLFSRLIKTRTHGVRIATHKVSFSLPSTRLHRPPPGSSIPWARPPSRYRRSNVCWRRWRAPARAPPLAASTARVRQSRLYSGMHRARRSMRCCRTSSRAY